MDLRSAFDQFLASIRLTDNQLEELKSGHSTLRNRLAGDEDLASITITTFLQGSYRRSTAVRPKNDQRADVDIVVVTTLHEADYTPHQAMERFKPFLERHYKGKWRFQGRSIGIEMSAVDLDIVLTSAPSEAVKEVVLSKSLRGAETIEEATWEPPLDRAGVLYKSDAKQERWKLEPLRIPNRDAQCWDDTHPLEQIRVTYEKNKTTGGRYVNVVKALKWWRRINNEPPHPKGYPLEHLVWKHCPDSISTIAEGVVLTLESIRDAYATDAAQGLVPMLPDHGVPTHNVLGRVSGTDFAAFHALVTSAAKIAREALEAESRETSHQLWQKLFGGKFPDPPTRGRGTSEGNGGDDGGGFTPRGGPTVLPTTGERWG